MQSLQLKTGLTFPLSEQEKQTEIGADPIVANFPDSLE